MKSSSHSVIPSPLQFPATPLLQSSVAYSQLRVSAGSNDIDGSCDGDVEEEVDNSPRTANWTKFSVLLKV